MSEVDTKDIVDYELEIATRILHEAQEIKKILQSIKSPPPSPLEKEVEELRSENQRLKERIEILEKERHS